MSRRNNILWWISNQIHGEANTILWWAGNTINWTESLVWWFGAQSTGFSNVILSKQDSTISWDYSTILWCATCSIVGSNGTILWGAQNYINIAGWTEYSIILWWQRSKILHERSFVYNNEYLNGSYFETTQPNQFLINSSNGVGINTNDTSAATFTVNGTIKWSYVSPNNNPGLSQTVNLMGANSAACTMTIEAGIITATDCQ